MKKRIFVVVIDAVVIILAAIFIGKIVYEKNNSQSAWRTESGIKDIVFGNSVSYYTVTDEEDIKRVLDAVGESELEEIEDNEMVYGYAAVINIRYQSGKSDEIVIRSNTVVMQGKSYKCTEEYCNRILSLYDELADSYEKNFM